jgi:hypothetical protein
MSFTIDDKIFENIKNYLSQNTIDLINASPLLVNLLQSYKDSGNILYLSKVTSEDPSPSPAAYDDNSGTISIYPEALGSGTSMLVNFIRLTAHELGHFYNDQFAGGLTTYNGFTDIVNQAMDEARATAISYIVGRQIMLRQADGNLSGVTIDYDQFVSNKIYNNPDAANILATLDDQFLKDISPDMSVTDAWNLTQPIADQVWSLNFGSSGKSVGNRHAPGDHGPV